MTLLPNILCPKDLKKLSLTELKSLAKEIRERIISVMAKNGGHLASNLGMIELTLGLHYIFDSPDDKFIFDVSHQTYTHKLITGRNHTGFDKIRKSGGLNGFAHPKESEHDHFYAGHAGTALPLALGMARARTLNNQNNHIIPIIGDATLTCGLSLEALNNISKELPNFIVILNDNEMSISKNVGGITNILSRLINNPTTSKFKREIEAIISKIPLYGSKLANQGHKVSESIQNLVSDASFFEQFGLSYIGPIDGQDLDKIIPTLENIKNCKMPLIIHCLTKKGQGVEEAEKDPVNYHGAKPFNPTTGKFVASSSKKSTFPKICGQQLVAMGEQNKKLALVTPAMSLGSCLDAFHEKFPDRFFDVGIAEGHAVTFSGGLAKTGSSHVVCSIYSTFFQRALDNLFHDVCLQQIPVIFAVDRAGLATGDGATHHGIYEMSFLRAMPNMVICQPRNGQLLKELLESAFTWQRPTAIRYPNMETEPGELPLKKRPLGKGEVLAKGQDLLIVALGHHVFSALKLRDKLLEKGITATVVDPIFVKPLDSDLFGKLLLTHNNIVTIEEHSLKGGLGSAMNEFIVTNGFQSSVLNFGIPEAFIDHGSYEDLLQQIGLTPNQMLQKILAYFSLSQPLATHSP